MTDQAPPAPNLDALLCFAVYSTGLAFNRVYRRPLERLGITYPQYLVMAALWSEDDLSVGELGKRLSLDTNTLTPLVKRIEAMGLVTRRRSTADERRVTVALTDKGRTMRSEVGAVMACIAEAAGLPETEVVRLTDEIRALRSNLERAAANHPEPEPA
jgi:DNA-binding MarR family transcriptional regulator